MQGIFSCAIVKTHTVITVLRSPFHQWEKLDDLSKTTTVELGFEFSGLPQSPLSLEWNAQWSFIFSNSQASKRILETRLRPILRTLGKWLLNTGVNREETRNFTACNSFTFPESWVLYGRLMRTTPWSSFKHSQDTGIQKFQGLKHAHFKVRKTF